MATNKKGTVRRRISDALGKALDKFEKRVSEEDASFNPSIAEYLKLMQLKKELDEEEEEDAKEIKVTWVDPEGSENSK